MNEVLQQQLKDHIKADEVHFKAVDNTVNKISDDINIIKNNHLQHLEQDVNTLKTDVGWIKKIQWFLITSSIGILITLLVGLVTIILRKQI